MGKILVIAEKPSVARDIYAPFLEKLEGQKFVQKTGYFESEKYCLTWAIGHLFGLSEPESYGYTKWDLSQLPMLPETFTYKISEGKAEQFKIIKKLTSECSEIYNAGDAAREGELIVRLIVDQAGATHKLTKRLWQSSNAFEDLKKAWLSMKPSSHYEGYYNSALSRSKLDWITGMNLTRAYTTFFQGEVLSVGRVQTPVLNLIVCRDLEIANWKDSNFYEVHGLFGGVDFAYINEVGDREFLKENLATSTAAKLTGLATINHFKGVKKSTDPKKPYDLTSLQQDMNKKHGLSAARTLEVAQKLYEAGLISYPRTDCEYLPEGMKSEAIETALQHATEAERALLKSSSDRLSFFNDKKISDHYAIIPTKQSQNVKDDEKLVYDMIRARFVMAFMRPYSFEHYECALVCNGEKMVGNAYVELDRGFKAMLNDNDKSEGNWLKAAPNFKVGTQGPLENVHVVEKKRTKPKPYNEATLLGDMKTAGKFIEQEELREAMKDRGLGTPATQAGIIENIISRGYVDRKNNNLISSQKGKSLISLIDDKLKSAEMTGEMEMKLKLIERGELKPDDFHESSCQFVTQHIQEIRDGRLKNRSAVGLSGASFDCPECKNPMKINDSGFFCTPCDLKIWKNVFGKKLTDEQMKEILSRGKSSKVIKGFKKYNPETKKFTGDSYEAHLQYVNRQIKILFEEREASKTTGHICPTCGKNVILSKFGYYCEAKCGFKIGVEILGVKITDTMVAKIIKNGRTDMIKGFKSSKGKIFDAILALDEKKVISFVFEDAS